MAGLTRPSPFVSTTTWEVTDQSTMQSTTSATKSPTTTEDFILETENATIPEIDDTTIVDLPADGSDLSVIAIVGIAVALIICIAILVIIIIVSIKLCRRSIEKHQRIRRPSFPVPPGVEELQTVHTPPAQNPEQSTTLDGDRRRKPSVPEIKITVNPDINPQSAYDNNAYNPEHTADIPVHDTPDLPEKNLNMKRHVLPPPCITRDIPLRNINIEPHVLPPPRIVSETHDDKQIYENFIPPPPGHNNPSIPGYVNVPLHEVNDNVQVRPEQYDNVSTDPAEHDYENRDVYIQSEASNEEDYVNWPHEQSPAPAPHTNFRHSGENRVVNIHHDYVNALRKPTTPPRKKRNHPIPTETKLPSMDDFGDRKS